MQCLKIQLQIYDVEWRKCLLDVTLLYEPEEMVFITFFQYSKSTTPQYDEVKFPAPSLDMMYKILKRTAIDETLSRGTRLTANWNSIDRYATCCQGH